MNVFSNIQQEGPRKDLQHTVGASTTAWGVFASHCHPYGFISLGTKRQVGAVAVRDQGKDFFLGNEDLVV